MNDPKSQKGGFWPFSGVESVDQVLKFNRIIGVCLGEGELEKVVLEEIGLRSHLVNIICGLQCTVDHDVDSNITQWRIHAAQINLCGSVTIGVDALTTTWSIHATHSFVWERDQR